MLGITKEQNEILEALDGAGASSLKQLKDLITYTEESQLLKEDLNELLRLELVKRYSNCTWSCTKAGKKLIGKIDEVKRKQESSQADKPKTERKADSVSSMPMTGAYVDPDSIPERFNKAAKKHVVDNLALKIDVLDRLAALMADDIADLLQSIRHDITK